MSPKKPRVTISENGSIENSAQISHVIKSGKNSQAVNLSQISSSTIRDFLSQQQSEIDQLKDQVQNLTEFLSGMAAAFEKMSDSQSLLSDTVANLLSSQEHFVKALINNHAELGEVKEGIDELLRRLPPPNDNSEDPK